MLTITYLAGIGSSAFFEYKYARLAAVTPTATAVPTMTFACVSEYTKNVDENNNKYVSFVQMFRQCFL